MDDFAQIAKKGIGGKSELLAENKPQKVNKNICHLTSTSSNPIKTIPKMSTCGELKSEVENLRNRYAEFLENHAPVFEELNDKIILNSFNVDGEKITIPHYGGPCGNSMKVYETDFDIGEKSEDKAYYICFKGADYYAVVYVNGVCVGTHEGFFSPFEFNIDSVVKNGKNSLKIDLYNDYIYMGNAFATQKKIEGDKLYAATGLGWDDPQDGWHHCPPGMGIYDEVFVEIRNRVSISDIFVRKNEIWVDVLNADYHAKNIEFNIFVYGQNFKETILENYRYIPSTSKTVGMGDSLTEAAVKDEIGKATPMPIKKGLNLFKIPFEIKNPKIWNPDTPYLYQIQIEIFEDGKICDKKSKQFGLRSFIQDVENEPKGMFYLNGRKIRLRGANTMGFEQQDVLNGDIEQLIDDILIAKICNMNFLRLTQRPVQDKVYEYCDRLGLMTQTDLPLFGCMRRTKLAEGIRQVEEMEKIVRNHPCNVIISYINEPFPNANNEPHRHMERHELESFFDCCDVAVKMQNPDRIIKHVDGDYDPPSKTMPDNHCYPMWYNGHGIDIGRLHKGYWLATKPGWYYGCGEYGAEGLDFEEIMTRYYPKEWLKEPFDPCNIVNAQTGNFCYFFYDKGENMKDWIDKSLSYQAFATKLMTEAFRRNPNMVSSAIHLFIDAWPSGWMKTIMDCKRNPKPAYFAYKNALEPILISLRTDRFTYFVGEKINIECFICNDTNINSDNYRVIYELYRGDKLMLSGDVRAKIDDCIATYSSECSFVIDDVVDRENMTVKAILVDENGTVVAYNSIDIEVFEDVDLPLNENVILVNPEIGVNTIAGEEVSVKECGMLPVNFVSRKTGHNYVEEFECNDFSYWYNKREDMITPIADKTFTAKGFTPILTSGNIDQNGKWTEALVCAEKEFDGKKYILCTVDLRTENPVAKRFLRNVVKG